MEQQINSAGDRGWFLECCSRKVSFDATVKQGYEIFSRIYENYGARAQRAEQNEGIDWKALSHAVRVGREAVELLKTGEITFPLADAAHILAIKKGRLPYDTVADEIEGLLVDVEREAAVSSLRDEADWEFIDELVARTYGDVVRAA